MWNSEISISTLKKTIVEEELNLHTPLDVQHVEFRTTYTSSVN
jgi:hypothetical protein